MPVTVRRRNKNLPIRNVEPRRLPPVEHQFKPGHKGDWRSRTPQFSFTELAKRILGEPVDYNDPQSVNKLEYLVRTVISKAIEGDRCCLVELLARIDPSPKGDREERATKVIVNMITEGAVSAIREGVQQSLDAAVTPHLLTSQREIVVERGVSNPLFPMG